MLDSVTLLGYGSGMLHTCVRADAARRSSGVVATARYVAMLFGEILFWAFA